MVKARISRRRAVKTIRVTFGTDLGEAEDEEDGAEEATGGVGLLAIVIFADMRMYSMCSSVVRSATGYCCMSILMACLPRVLVRDELSLNVMEGD